MKTLKAYYENTLVGVISQTSDLVYSFSYEESWQKNPKAFPLSLAMPLTQKDYGNKITLSFFENLLPEGEVRQRLEVNHQIKDSFEFLRKFGHDCAGAIIVTDQEDYIWSTDPTQITPVKMNDVYTAIRDHESVADVIANTKPGYLSLAGAQDKFPAIYKNKKFYLPLGGAPTTHIVKVPIWRSGVNESVYNEYYCMQLAKEIGLQVPNSLIVAGEFPLFVIERYDRYQDDSGAVHRIHQQDFCQAHGFLSQNKYEVQGGPSLKNNYNLILEHVTVKQRVENLNNFIDWVCFNLFIGNNDSHSKNISLLVKDKKIILAPFYDLMCTALYTRLKKNFSFMIGDRDYVHQIGKVQFEMLEDQCGLKRGLWLEHLQDMNDRILTAKEQVAHEVSKLCPSNKIIVRINDLISQRSKGFKAQRAIV